ncbi:MAG TPA: hypothetical protein VH724_03205 [Candidatus Angelobacter sp.]|nr:hypothetical protein [Candidatus Angelobacter sp.]
MNEDMTPFSHEAKNWGARKGQGQLYGKTAVRASDFLSREPRNTRLGLRNSRVALCRDKGEIVKKQPGRLRVDFLSTCGEIQVGKVNRSHKNYDF